MSEWMYGINPVREALLVVPDRALCLAVADSSNRAVQDLVQLAKRSRNSGGCFRKSRLDRLSKDGNHQGVCLEIKPFPYKELDEVLAAEGGADGPILVMDQVQDPQNVGAMLRTAKAVGCRAVVWAKDRQAQVTPVVIRASAGAALQLPIIRVTNLSRALEELQEAGYWVVGMAGESQSCCMILT